MQQSNWPSYNDNTLPEQSSSDASLDLFTKKDGLCFAGTHIILDCWGASRLNELDHIEQSLRDAVAIAGATLLHIHLHHFTPNGGVSGVAVLAESHISIHTWPERAYAALDIFISGLLSAFSDGTIPRKCLTIVILLV